MKSYFYKLPFAMGGAISSLKIRVFDRAIPMLFLLRSHVRLRAVLGSASNVELTKKHPKLLYKYLRGNYLYLSLSKAHAAKVMHTHYAVLQQHFKPGFLTRVFDEQVVLWGHSREEREFKIRLTFPRDQNIRDRMLDHEGDLSLMFEMDGAPLFILCMTIVPAHLLLGSAMAGERAMFVGRIQGAPSKVSELKAATVAMNNVAPARLLIAAAEAIACRFKIETIVGVCNSQQLSRAKHPELQDFFDYDTFWTTLGASPGTGGLFSVPCPIPDKPIQQVQQKHRQRTLKKRTFRQELADTVYANFSNEIG